MNFALFFLMVNFELIAGLDVEVVKLEFSQEELKVIEQSDSVEMIDMLLHEVSSVSEQSENLVLFELPDKISLGESNIVLGRYNFIYITKETSIKHRNVKC